DVLILFSDRLTKTVDFNMAGQFRQLGRVEETPAMGVKGLEEPCCETAGRSKTRSRRYVGESGDFNLRCPEIEYLYCFADNRVNHVLCQFHMLEVGVLEIDPRREWPHHSDVNILVDC